MPDETTASDIVGAEISATLNNALRWVEKKVRSMIGESDKSIHQRLDAIERKLDNLSPKQAPKVPK